MNRLCSLKRPVFSHFPLSSSCLPLSSSCFPLSSRAETRDDRVLVPAMRTIATFSKPSQLHIFSTSQSFLLCSAPSLQMFLPCNRITYVAECGKIYQLHRPTLECVTISIQPLLVLRHAHPIVIRDSRVVAPIRASEHVDKVFIHKRNMIAKYFVYNASGGMAEWSKAPDLKSGRPHKGLVGSNPTPSAIRLGASRLAHRSTVSSRLSNSGRRAFGAPAIFVKPSRMTLSAAPQRGVEGP